MLPEAGGLIHMNGRVYDPQLGRFLSADFLIPNGEHTESYNRYSYVFNNPLSLTDPDGQCPVCAIVVVIIGGAATYTATTIAATIVMSSFFGMMAAAVATEGDPKAMLQGAVSGALFAWIGGAIQPGAGAGGALSGGQIAAKIAVHAVAGGLINSAFGGDFRSGALAGGFGAAVGSMSGLQINEYSGWGQVIAVGDVRTVAGGIGAELGGGKFVNGAATAAFAYLFNDARAAFASPQPGRASNSQSLEKTAANANKDGKFWSENGCGDSRCTTTDVNVHLIVDGARASSQDSAQYDQAVFYGGKVLGAMNRAGAPSFVGRVAVGVIDTAASFSEKMFSFGLGEKPPALQGGDIVMQHTAQGSGGYGTVFTYTQILRQDFQNPGQWYRFRY